MIRLASDDVTVELKTQDNQINLVERASSLNLSSNDSKLNLNTTMPSIKLVEAVNSIKIDNKQNTIKLVGVGRSGQDGTDGLSAYEQAVQEGFVGTLSEWLGSLKSYYRTTFSNQSTVTVTHNLDKYPAVTVINSANDQVEGAIEYLSTNSLIASFNGSFSGSIVCN